MEATTTDWLLVGIGGFCFGYPFVMALYWVVGGLMFYITRERHMAPPDRPPLFGDPPPISILVPCYNEGDNAAETLETAAAVDYPEFEVIAINDGSRDNTGKILNQLATRIPKLRVAHLASNQGKATALNVGALMAMRCSIPRRCSGSHVLFAEAMWVGWGATPAFATAARCLANCRSANLLR
jgi:biofilm PGA synthesis N-glycosyltransferase PgaC